MACTRVASDGAIKNYRSTINSLFMGILNLSIYRISKELECTFPSWNGFWFRKSREHIFWRVCFYVLFYVCQNYIYATWTQFWRKGHKFTFCLVRCPSHLLTYLWNIHVILIVINQQLGREQGYVLGKTHTYIIMQIAGVVYTCIVNFHHGQLSPEDLLYIYILL